MLSPPGNNHYRVIYYWLPPAWKLWICICSVVQRSELRLELWRKNQNKNAFNQSTYNFILFIIEWKKTIFIYFGSPVIPIREIIGQKNHPKYHCRAIWLIELNPLSLIYCEIWLTPYVTCKGMSKIVRTQILDSQNQQKVAWILRYENQLLWRDNSWEPITKNWQSWIKKA